MKTIGIALAAALLLTHTAQAAGPSAAQVIADAESTNAGVRNQALVYLSGMVAGITGVEGLHQHEGRPLVFCMPRDLVLKAGDLVGLAKAQLKAIPAMGGFDFQIVAIKALQAKYPCR